MTAMKQPKIVSPAEWLAARERLLEKEKELTRRHDELAAERRAMPWVRVENAYRFETETGPESLGDLFAGRSQLVIYHFMLGPGWQEGCPSCSLLVDHVDGARVHLAARDVTLTLVSHAPFVEIARFQRRMGWRLPWASSHGSDFNRDFHVSFTKDEIATGSFYYNYATKGFPSEEGPGLSVFAKDASGAIFHTYSTYARGAEPLIGAYYLLDMVPKGRDEAGLPWPMAWVRHHDRYGATEASACST